MRNKLTVLLAACLLVAAPFATAVEKMKLDADGDGKVSYEEYKNSKEKGHERQFKKMDSNGDGYIDAAEKQAQKDKMKAMREKRKQKAQ
jgi:EF hand